MASAISAITNGASSTTPSSSGTSGSDATEQTFLQLLVAQLQNQDPLSPQDSTQFVAELAQFNELDQTIGIRQDIESQMSSSASTSGTTSSSTSSSGQTSAPNSISS